jgi:Zn finger protein HypA/HybF involved in hydrogenase expression
MEQGANAEIIQFSQRQIERINGIKLNLGRLSLLELQVLEVQCSERFQEAHTDLTIVRDTLARRFPDGSVS